MEHLIGHNVPADPTPLYCPLARTSFSIIIAKFTIQYKDLLLWDFVVWITNFKVIQFGYGSG